MVFNDEDKFKEELEKHKGHKVIEDNDSESFLKGYRCEDCNVAIYLSTFK
jgi:hypothetical protein